MDIDEIIFHWMPHDFKAINRPNTLDEARLVVEKNLEVSCLAINKHNSRYTFNEILNRRGACLNRSKNVFFNIRKIIKNNRIDIEDQKFIFHFKGDACSFKYGFPILANSRNINNPNITLWPLCEKKNIIFHDEINKYLKNPDGLAWENKSSQFIFRGMNSGNPFSCVQYKWDTERNSRCDLLLEYLKLPEVLKALVDIGFYRLYPTHLKFYSYKLPDALRAMVSIGLNLLHPNHSRFDFTKNKIHYLENEFLKNLKDGKTLYDLQSEIELVVKYIKPPIRMKELLKYKYIFCPEGFDCSSSLCWVLASNSLAIVPPFHYENSVISSKRLKPYVHFLPIKEDYSNLGEVIQWAINNDGECKEMVRNANNYMRHFINKESMLLVQKTIVEKLLC